MHKTITTALAATALLLAATPTVAQADFGPPPPPGGGGELGPPPPPPGTGGGDPGLPPLPPGGGGDDQGNPIGGPLGGVPRNDSPQPQPSPQRTPRPAADTTKPTLHFAAKPRAGRHGKLVLKVASGEQVRATIAVKRLGRRGSKRIVFKQVTLRAGDNRLALSLRRKSGRYVVTVVASDSAGNSTRIASRA